MPLIKKLLTISMMIGVNDRLVSGIGTAGSISALQDFSTVFRQIAAKNSHGFQRTILRCRNAFEAVAAEVAWVAEHTFAYSRRKTHLLAKAD
jgi:hypothetical protein